MPRSAIICRQNIQSIDSRLSFITNIINLSILLAQYKVPPLLNFDYQREKE
jgi:hypothetical protein